MSSEVRSRQGFIVVDKKGYFENLDDMARALTHIKFVTIGYKEAMGMVYLKGCSEKFEEVDVGALVPTYDITFNSPEEAQRLLQDRIVVVKRQ